jgi:hypothetical protein
MSASLLAKESRMLKVPVVVAVLSGSFALVGGFLGARLTRRTEYEKWLRQARSVAFSEFLRQLHTVLEKAIPITCSSESKQQQDQRITEIFLGLNAQENIVRLYLAANDRDRFSELVKKLWILHGPSIKAECRLEGVKKHLSGIQGLFERTIDAR